MISISCCPPSSTISSGSCLAPLNSVVSHSPQPSNKQIHTLTKLLKRNSRNSPRRLSRIISPEHARHPLHIDANLHEKIKAQSPPTPDIVSVEDLALVFFGEVEAEGREGVLEFFEVDMAAVVFVEFVEKFAPFVEVVPEAAVEGVVLARGSR